MQAVGHSQQVVRAGDGGVLQAGDVPFCECLQKIVVMAVVVVVQVPGIISNSIIGMNSSRNSCNSITGDHS